MAPDGRLLRVPAAALRQATALALALLRPRPEDLFGEVNWSVLVFFCGLFVIVGGVAGGASAAARARGALRDRLTQVILPGPERGLVLAMVSGRDQTIPSDTKSKDAPQEAEKATEADTEQPESEQAQPLSSS